MTQIDSDLSLSNINAGTQVFATQELAKNQLLYPSEYVVRLLSKIKTHKTIQKEALDIGFGSGQHLKLLMDFGFRASGVELIPTAGDRVHHLYGDNPLFGEIIIDDFRNTKFQVSHFDVIIAWGVLFLRPLKEIYIDLKNIFDRMNPDGQICMNFRTKDNWFYGLGKQLDDEYFFLDERAGNYAGSYYTFMDELTVRNLMTETGFELINFERWDWWKNNMKEKHSWWILWAKRPV